MMETLVTIGVGILLGVVVGRVWQRLALLPTLRDQEREHRNVVARLKAECEAAERRHEEERNDLEDKLHTVRARFHEARKRLKASERLRPQEFPFAAALWATGEQAMPFHEWLARKGAERVEEALRWAATEGKDEEENHVG